MTVVYFLVKVERVGMTLWGCKWWSKVVLACTEIGKTPTIVCNWAIGCQSFLELMPSMASF